MQNMKVSRSAGFTLVEIMVVVVILGLLATVGSMGYMSYLKKSKIKLAKTKCVELENGIESFTSIEGGSYSADEIFDKMKEQKVIKHAQDLEDPWGNPFQVIKDEDGNFTVFSMGADGQRDTEDDITRRGMASEAEEDF